MLWKNFFVLNRLFSFKTIDQLIIDKFQWKLDKLPAHFTFPAPNSKKHVHSFKYNEHTITTWTL